MNSNSQHTPVPWQAYGENVCAKLASDTRSEIIATTCGFQSTQRNLANAHLMASAPELLAALAELREWCVSEYQSKQMPNGCILETLLMDADKAIAKAKGSQ